MNLLVNRVQCPKCKDIIESRNVHDWVSCSCEHTYTDGGRNYLRCTLDAIDLSIYDDGKHETRREHLEWGTRGLSNKEPLKYIKIKDLSDDHLAAILRTQNLSGIYLEVMEDESLFRLKQLK